MSRRPVERRVRIRTVTEEIPARFDEALHGERVEIQHIAVERELDAPPDIRVEGDVTIIPVIEERLIVEKRLFLVEEVHVRRLTGVEEVQQPVTLKRQRVVVERSETSGGSYEED